MHCLTSDLFCTAVSGTIFFSVCFCLEISLLFKLFVFYVCIFVFENKTKFLEDLKDIYASEQKVVNL